MARVTGPLMSMDASGKLSDAMVFSKWKGRNYVRSYAVPSNPRSKSQLAIRAVMSGCQRLWGTLESAESAAWQELATSLGLTARNVFVQYANANVAAGFGPAQLPNSPPFGQTFTASQTGTGTVNRSGTQLSVTGISVTATGLWALALYAYYNEGETATLVDILPAGSTTATFYVDPTVLALGNLTVGVRGIKENGALSDMSVVGSEA